MVFAGRIGSIYRSAVLLSILYNILDVCQKNKILRLPFHLIIIFFQLHNHACAYHLYCHYNQLPQEQFYRYILLSLNNLCQANIFHNIFITSSKSTYKILAFNTKHILPFLGNRLFRHTSQ